MDPPQGRVYAPLVRRAVVAALGRPVLKLERDLVGVGAVLGRGGDDALAHEDLAEAWRGKIGGAWWEGGGAE